MHQIVYPQGPEAQAVRSQHSKARIRVEDLWHDAVVRLMVLLTLAILICGGAAAAYATRLAAGFEVSSLLMLLMFLVAFAVVVYAGIANFRLSLKLRRELRVPVMGSSRQTTWIPADHDIGRLNALHAKHHPVLVRYQWYMAAAVAIPAMLTAIGAFFS